MPWKAPYLRLALQGVLDESSALDYLANRHGGLMKPGSIGPSIGFTAYGASPNSHGFVLCPWINLYNSNIFQSDTFELWFFFRYTQFLDKFQNHIPTVPCKRLTRLHRSGRPQQISDVSGQLRLERHVIRRDTGITCCDTWSAAIVHFYFGSRDTCLVHLSSFWGVDKPSASPSSSTCCSSKVLQWFDNLCIACKALDLPSPTWHWRHWRLDRWNISIDIIHYSTPPKTTHYIVYNTNYIDI